MSARVAAVVLAAGASRRLGRPKQLVVYEGRTLLRRAVDTALASRCARAFVVLGEEDTRMHAELAGLDTTILDNPDWSQGLGTSVRLGASAAAADASVDAVLLALVDQPLVESALHDRLIAAFESGAHDRAAAAYAGSLGAPALFGRRHFAALAELPAEAGARSLLRAAEGDVARVDAPEAAFDLDTPADLDALRAREGR